MLRCCHTRISRPAVCRDIQRLQPFSEVTQTENNERPVKKKSDEAWQRKFEELAAFVDRNNHMRITTKDLALKRWLTRQRVFYSRREEGEANSLSEQRIQQLNSLGIVWKVQDTNWEENYQTLKRFKEENGHLDLTRWHDLYYWCQAQRKHYKATSSMAEDRIAKLNELGFVWDQQEAVWKEQYEALRQYRDYHGHCVVPRGWAGNPSLARWVDIQRQQLRKSKEGETNALTPQRKELLDEIGFVWNVPSTMWHKRFNELREYTGVNGLGVTPKVATPLGRWVVNQRKLYERLQQGEKVTLNEERLSLLRSLGFCL